MSKAEIMELCSFVGMEDSGDVAVILVSMEGTTPPSTSKTTGKVTWNWLRVFNMVAEKKLILSYLTGAMYFLIDCMDLPEFHILFLDFVNKNPSPWLLQRRSEHFSFSDYGTNMSGGPEITIAHSN